MLLEIRIVVIMGWGGSDKKKIMKSFLGCDNILLVVLGVGFKGFFILRYLFSWVFMVCDFVVCMFYFKKNFLKMYRILDVNYMEKMKKKWE